MRILEVGVGKAGRTHPESVTVDLYEEDADHKVDIGKNKLPFKDGSFDSVEASHVLEHLSFQEIDHCVRELHRVLKKGGTLHVKTPHYGGRSMWCTPTHKTPFSTATMLYWCGVHDTYLRLKPLFRQDRVRLNYVGTNRKAHRVLKQLLAALFNLLAGFSPAACERFWMYWVGGFEEVEYWLEKL